MSYTGPERRKSDMIDHDLIIEIHSNVKHIADSFRVHIEEDKVSFKEIKHDADILKRFMWVLIGGGAVVQLVFHFVK